MTKPARDRIQFPCREWLIDYNESSQDGQITTRALVERILDDMGNFTDAIEGPYQQDYSHIEWNQLAGLRSVLSRAPSPAAITDFVVDKANSISAAYSGAMRRRRQENPRATSELLEFYDVVSGMFRKTSPGQLLKLSLRNTKSLQDLIDLFEQHSSKIVSSYDAIHPYKPPTHLPSTTTQALQVSTPVLLLLASEITLPASILLRLNIVTHSSRGAPWWKRLQRRLSKL